MRVVVAIDSFKGSLSSMQAGTAVKEAILRLDETADVLVKPLADGGEGTVEALASGMGGELIKIPVTGPLGKPVIAQYCILKDSYTAVIEMAAAAGITLLSPEERNPMETTTYGVGELIRDGIKRGCRNFIVGIGGSATNDGGVGMLTALGFAFLDQEQNPIPQGAKGFEKLHTIQTDQAFPQLQECTFRIACNIWSTMCVLPRRYRKTQTLTIPVLARRVV